MSCLTEAGSWKAISAVFTGRPKLSVVTSVPLSLWPMDLEEKGTSQNTIHRTCIAGTGIAGLLWFLLLVLLYK